METADTQAERQRR